MKVSDIGEFELIDRLSAILPENGKEVQLGIGDDCAIIDRGNHLSLWTTDSTIENIHYLPWLTTSEEIGRKALIVNISDIAAMGGSPEFATVSLTVPSDTSVEWLEGLYRGIARAARTYGVSIIGGNTTSSNLGLGIHIGVMGAVDKEEVLLRENAQTGDSVLVTENVGDGYCGLECAFHPAIDLPHDTRKKLIRHYTHPVARVKEGRIIASSGLANSMMDISDGLAGDMGHICDRSNVGVQFDTNLIPISEEVKSFAQKTDRPAWHYGLIGGDDYGLLLTCPPQNCSRLQELVKKGTGTKLYEIGQVVAKERGRTLILPDRKQISLELSSWQHF